MKKVFLLSVIIFSLAAFAAAKAATQGDVVINEIAWMGGVNSASDEWIELKNTTNQDISVFGWILKSQDEKIKIKLKGFIIADGFYLIERTDDNSVPDIPADLIYKGALSNAGEDLALYDTSNTIVDQLHFSTTWPAGDNTTKQTMEKTFGVPFGSWQTSKNPNGTPKAKNSLGTVKIVKPTPVKPMAKETAVLPKDQKTDNKTDVGTASVSDSVNLFSDNLEKTTTSNPWILFLTVLVISVICAIIILLLKIKFLKK